MIVSWKKKYCKRQLMKYVAKMSKMNCLNITGIHISKCGICYFPRYVLGFLCHLVECGIFDKVKVSFLIVGHTHEDVDQVFSRWIFGIMHGEEWLMIYIDIYRWGGIDEVSWWKDQPSNCITTFWWHIFFILGHLLSRRGTFCNLGCSLYEWIVLLSFTSESIILKICWLCLGWPKMGPDDTSFCIVGKSDQLLMIHVPLYGVTWIFSCVVE